ncbi:tRNA adenosine(34) deaminase TadA [Ruminococcaceae bacterium OttesenSCG-928-N02]|nr:tRNA adenosine(34) deaminase TadA [Ruminococcaceae bacterium OttesenSCG-928-N02]
MCDVQRDEEFMRLALAQAHLAEQEGEVPVGALVVQGGAVIGTGYNRREGAKSALAHAEMLAIAQACETLGGWRLPGCTLYVTLEPCPMCAGAIINSRIERVVFGAADAKAGCTGSITNLFSMPFNHKPALAGGVLGQECGDVLKRFFSNLREKK